MYKLLLFCLILLMVSCKNDTPAIKITPPKRISRGDTITEGRILKIDTLLYSKYNSPTLTAFYQKFENETVWQSAKKRALILAELSQAENEGLNPSDYHIKKLNAFEKKFSSLSDKEMVNYDLLLTYNLQKYIRHISQGKLNPMALYKNWELNPKKNDVVKILLNSYKSTDFWASLDSCKPQHLVYKRLKSALVLLNTFPKDTLKKITFEAKIIPNDTNNALLKIKQKLVYWNDLKKPDSLTNIYDSRTVTAIKKFQTRHGLAADGVIGKGTIAALNFTKEQRRQQIVANLERWKWYQQDLGKQYLIINIPDYSLHVVHDNDTIRTHKIIVGSAKRKTPVLSSKLSYAVFNPTWTVPPTIIKEDVIPATLKNRNYLAEKNITVYDANGNVVEASHWKASRARGYRYVQSPGTYNSLGMVKLIFPNRFSVYLHDTNHRDYFDKTNRSLSSGCVRVDNPLELTAYLLNDTIQYSKTKIADILKDGKTQNVRIPSETYLYLWYWTAWSEEGKLIFRDDIYDLDEELYKKLRN
ncbi:L,D-transpeptidase family protein [Flavobacterium sp. XGLA_31]|uniref:L,D-transpeptidase family protein n=1 Tax=Flavobacterium sp. XGLA_31 TaxID=3447666 RepID=UPI003F417B33